MSISAADVRLMLDRMRGLFHRGVFSLRTRGWRATWMRLKRQFARPPRVPAALLYLPDPAPFAPLAVPLADAPRASIVIPVYNHAACTLACLRALAAHPPTAMIEIIVVDDGSEDETASWTSRIKDLRYHRRTRNGGFIAACNDGAQLARGEYLVFLNNDTVPQPGWLDELLATFDHHDGVGLVGAQLLYPDGRLQEAGGVVFSDGSAWNYGRFESPSDPRFGHVRDCDYCSGAALAIRRELFESLGGFDSHYRPAYYEDTELAFAVRAAGKRVLYQPRARVVHDEGTTSGIDPQSGAKAYQNANRAKFADKWRNELAQRPAPDSLPGPGLLARDRPQVLIVDAQTPRPDRDSGSLRLVNLMRLLLQEGAHVTFLPADLRFAEGGTEAMQALGIEVWYAPFVRSAAAWFREHGPRFDTVMLSRHHVASEFLPLTRKHTHARIVFDTVDLHYLRERRAAEHLASSSLLREAERTRRRELATIAGSDLTLVVSPVERDMLVQEAPCANVEILGNLHEIHGCKRNYRDRHNLLFVGGFLHPPNADAVRWFIADILPRVRAHLPNVTFHCIGSDPPADIAAFDGHDGVRIHGHIPDLEPYLQGARIALAPLRYGAGIKGKVNLSMAHGQPVVATSCAIEGMHLHDGRDVLVADDPTAFADAVIRLYSDEATWNALSRHGMENVATHFSLDAARDTVRRVFLARRNG